MNPFIRLTGTICRIVFKMSRKNINDRKLFQIKKFRFIEIYYLRPLIIIPCRAKKTDTPATV
jgi:hypothetical protein